MPPRRTAPVVKPVELKIKAPKPHVAIVREWLRLMPLDVFAEGIDRLRVGNSTKNQRTD